MNDDVINNWIEGLIQVYTDVANKYLLPLEDLIRFMREKEERNENSHFKERIKEFILAQQQLSISEFIYDHTELGATFTEDELGHLAETFTKFCVFLQSSPKYY